MDVRSTIYVSPLFATDVKELPDLILKASYIISCGSNEELLLTSTKVSDEIKSYAEVNETTVLDSLASIISSASKSFFDSVLFSDSKLLTWFVTSSKAIKEGGFISANEITNIESFISKLIRVPISESGEKI